MKINLKRNFLKTTISGNIFALIGIGVIVYYLYIFIDSYIDYKQKGEIWSYLVPFLALAAYVTITQLKLIGISLIMLVIELLCKHRLKHKFFCENNIYNIIFYLGLLFNIFICLLSVLVYFFI